MSMNPLSGTGYYGVLLAFVPVLAAGAVGNIVGERLGRAVSLPFGSESADHFARVGGNIGLFATVVPATVALLGVGSGLFAADSLYRRAAARFG